jgi:hypothetical protein
MHSNQLVADQFVLRDQRGSHRREACAALRWRRWFGGQRFANANRDGEARHVELYPSMKLGDRIEEEKSKQ